MGRDEKKSQDSIYMHCHCIPKKRILQKQQLLNRKKSRKHLKENELPISGVWHYSDWLDNTVAEPSMLSWCVILFSNNQHNASEHASSTTHFGVACVQSPGLNSNTFQGCRITVSSQNLLACLCI